MCCPDNVQTHEECKPALWELRLNCTGDVTDGCQSLQQMSSTYENFRDADQYCWSRKRCESTGDWYANPHIFLRSSVSHASLAFLHNGFRIAVMQPRLHGLDLALPTAAAAAATEGSANSQGLGWLAKGRRHDAGMHSLHAHLCSLRPKVSIGAPCKALMSSSARSQVFHGAVVSMGDGSR